jgi:hypothetical protein
MPSGVHDRPAEQDGDNWSAGNEHDTPEDPGFAGADTPLGTGDGEARNLGDLDAGEPPLRVAAILERFAANTRTRFKDGGSTRPQYERTFRRFATHAGLESVSRQQLAGRKGRELLLNFMGTVPLLSRRMVLAALECAWTEGIALPWPIITRRDFGKTLPPAGQRETPPDEDVRPWVDAISKETDPYTRLLVLCIAQYGWRPENQIGHLKWRNVRYDEAGRPHAIVARSVDESFKTHADIVARIWPDVGEALIAWKKDCPDVSPGAFILPRRGTTGKVDPSRGMDKEAIHRLLRRFEAKWGLKHLAPVYFRHWVKTTCRPLSDPALARLQGHKPPADGSMRSTYDTPGIQRVLAEQESKFPTGPLGVLRSPAVIVEPELRAELDLVRLWKAGQLGLMELMNRLEALERKVVGVPDLKP